MHSMVKANKQRMSVSMNSISEPIFASKENFTTMLPNQARRYDKIEEVAGRPIDEILLENLQLQNRRTDMGVQIQKLNETISKTKTILYQLLDIELSLNPDVAIPIANEFEINRRTGFASNIDRVEVVTEALRKIRYYYHPSLREWMEIVKKSENSVSYYKTRNEYLEIENNQLKQRILDLEENGNGKVKNFAHGITVTHYAGKLITSSAKQENEVKAVPLGNAPTSEHGDNASTEEGVQLGNVRYYGEKAKDFEGVAPNQTIHYEHIPNQSPTKHVVVIEDSEFGMTAKVIHEPRNVQKVSSTLGETEVPNQTMPTAVETNPQVNEPIVQETVKQVPEQAVISEPSKQEPVKEVKEHDVLDELKKPKYLMLLDKKGYDYELSSEPQYDVMIRNKSGKVPLLYIDYLIDQAEVFDNIMKETNEIYILFDSKENMKKGNAKFASWLLRSKEKRKIVRFSFTTVDELKVSGLDELNGL